MTIPTGQSVSAGAMPASALLLALGLLVSGCASAAGGHPAALASAASRLSGGPAPGASPSHIRQYLPHTSPPVVTPVGSPAPAAPAPVQPVAAGPAPCPASGLHVALGPANGAAGSFYYPIEFTNTTAAPCTLYGYPGVSFATGPGGASIGGAALRNPTSSSELVTLDAGATAHASLQVAIAENYPASICKPVTAHWLAIYPPASYVPLYLAFTAATCTGDIPTGTTLGIYVVTPGATGQ
jgi:hypothetical protein